MSGQGLNCLQCSLHCAVPRMSRRVRYLAATQLCRLLATTISVAASIHSCYFRLKDGLTLQLNLLTSTFIESSQPTFVEYPIYPQQTKPQHRDRKRASAKVQAGPAFVDCLISAQQTRVHLETPNNLHADTPITSSTFSPLSPSPFVLVLVLNTVCQQSCIPNLLVTSARSAKQTARV